MSFSDKLKDFVDQSIKVSKEAAKQVGDKAQQWGEMGVIKIEITQLKAQATKLTAKLGADVFETFIEKGQKTISRDSPAIKDILDQLEALDKQIDEKSEEYKNIGGKESDLNNGADSPNPENPEQPQA